MPLHDLIREAQEYEKRRDIPAVCGQTWVQPTNAIVFNGVPHAGVATHVCALKPTHTGECVCKCRAHSLVKK